MKTYGGLEVRLCAYLTSKMEGVNRRALPEGSAPGSVRYGLEVTQIKFAQCGEDKKFLSLSEIVVHFLSSPTNSQIDVPLDISVATGQNC